MRLVDIEKDLKKLIENNANDTAVYNKIYELVYNFLLYKKALNTDLEYEEVAEIATEDLFLKIHNGNTITSWLGYINVSHFGYIRIYKKKFASEIIETEDSPEMADGITLMSASSLLHNPIDFAKTENLAYIEDSLEKTIDAILNKSVFMKYTSEYYIAKASIILSILLNKFVVVGKDKSNQNYIHILYILVKDKIIQTIGVGNNNLAEALRRYAKDYFYVEDVLSE